jgi:hypothetical protein
MRFRIYFKLDDNINRTIYCQDCHEVSSDPNEERTICPLCGSGKINQKWKTSIRRGDIFQVDQIGPGPQAVNGDCLYIGPDSFYELAARLKIDVDEIPAELMRHGKNRHSKYAVDIARAQETIDHLCILEKERD